MRALFWIIAILQARAWEKQERELPWVLRGCFSALWLLGTIALLMGVATLLLWGGGHH
jgi:hypothetical protein